MHLQLFIITTCLGHLVTTMHIPEDIEILDGYEFEPFEHGLPEELIGTRTLVEGKYGFQGIRNKRNPRYEVHESAGLKSHFHLNNKKAFAMQKMNENQKFKEALKIGDSKPDTGEQSIAEFGWDDDEEVHQRTRRSVEEEVRTSEKNESVGEKTEELPLAEKHYMESNNYREPREMDGWMKRPPFNNDFAKVQEEEEALAEASINEGIKARAPRVNFVTQAKKGVDTAETRERPTVAKPTEAYRRPYYEDYPQQLPRGYDAYSRRYDRYDPRDHMYDYYNPYDMYASRRRYENFDPYMPRTPNSFYYYPSGQQYDLPEPRDRDYYSGGYNDLNGGPPAISPINRNRRIIYYATLPDLNRTPPNVDLRYRSYKSSDRSYDPSYNSYTGTDAYRSNRSPRDYVRKPSNLPTPTPERPKENKEYNSNPVRISSSLKVNNQQRPPVEHRLYSEAKTVPRTINDHRQDGVEERDHTYFSRNH